MHVTGISFGDCSFVLLPTVLVAEVARKIRTRRCGVWIRVRFHVMEMEGETRGLVWSVLSVGKATTVDLLILLRVEL